MLSTLVRFVRLSALVMNSIGNAERRTQPKDQSGHARTAGIHSRGLCRINSEDSVRHRVLENIGTPKTEPRKMLGVRRGKSQILKSTKPASENGTPKIKNGLPACIKTGNSSETMGSLLRSMNAGVTSRAIAVKYAISKLAGGSYEWTTVILATAREVCSVIGVITFWVTDSTVQKYFVVPQII